MVPGIAVSCQRADRRLKVIAFRSASDLSDSLTQESIRDEFLRFSNLSLRCVRYLFPYFPGIQIAIANPLSVNWTVEVMIYFKPLKNFATILLIASINGYLPLSVCNASTIGEQQLVQVQSITDVFTNVKQSIDKNSLITGEFFSEQSLLKVFGGDEVKFSEFSTRATKGQVVNFSNVFQPQPQANTLVPAVNIGFSREVTDENKVHCVVRINLLPATTLDFDVLARILHVEWTKSNQPPPSHAQYSPATKINGNLKFLSYKVSKLATTHIEVQLYPNSTVEYFILQQDS